MFFWDEYLYVSLPEKWDAQLRHEDGSLTDFYMDWNASHGQDGIVTFSETFTQPMDISDVTAIFINGIEFPVS